MLFVNDLKLQASNSNEAHYIVRLVLGTELVNMLTKGVPQTHATPCIHVSTPDK